MTEIFYYDIKHLSDNTFQTLLLNYSGRQSREILRYKFISDQKSRLAAREIIKYFLLSQNYKSSMAGLSKTKNGKPFIPGAPFFNVSHSGTLVVVAFNDREVGIDIEQEKLIDVNSLLQYFNQGEITFLNRQQDILKAFYYLWVRKEAFLKAKGEGIIGGMSKADLLQDTIEEDGIKWAIQNIGSFNGYQCAICTRDNISAYRIHQFSL